MPARYEKTAKENKRFFYRPEIQHQAKERLPSPLIRRTHRLGNRLSSRRTLQNYFCHPKHPENLRIGQNNSVKNPRGKRTDMPNTNKKRPEPLFKHTNNKFTTLIKQYIPISCHKYNNLKRLHKIFLRKKRKKLTFFSETAVFNYKLLSTL